MKLLRFEAEGEARLGVLADGRAVDVEAGRVALRRDGRSDWPQPFIEGVHDAMRRGAWTLDEMRSLADAVIARIDTDAALQDGPERIAFDFDDVRLLNPMPGQNRIFTCRGLNPNTLWTQNVYAIPVYPTGDMASRNRLIGPRDPIELSPYPAGFDHEALAPPSWNPELGLIIGKRGHDIPRQEAMSYIAGYTIYVDGSGRGTARLMHDSELSARDCLRFGAEPTVAPWCMDHPIGPWITTCDEIDDPYEIQFTLIDSGIVIDVGYGRSLIFGVDELVHFLSQLMTLEPGDLVTTSALGFDGLAYRPDYRQINNPCLRVCSPQLGETLNPIVDRRYEMTDSPSQNMIQRTFDKEAPS